MAHEETTDYIQTLRKKHQELDDEADEMSIRLYLSPKDKAHLKSLKVQRLHVKELIETMLRTGKE